MELAPNATFLPASSLDTFFVIGSDKYAPIFVETGDLSVDFLAYVYYHKYLDEITIRKRGAQSLTSLHDRFGFLFSLRRWRHLGRHFSCMRIAFSRQTFDNFSLLRNGGRWQLAEASNFQSNFTSFSLDFA